MNAKLPLRSTAVIAATLLIAACGPFKIKPAGSAPAPTSTPTTTPTRPTTQPTNAPTNQPATPPTQGGARPTTPPTTPPTQTPPTTQGTPTRPGGAAAPTTTPATTPATTPGTTPATPPAAPRLTQDQIEAQRIKDDSTRLAGIGRGRRYSPVYFTLMFDVHNALLRTATGGVVAPEDEPTFKSTEISLQRARGGGLGIAARSMKSTEEYEYNELALLMGSRRFALDLGLASRTGYDSIGVSGGGAYDTLHVFPRVGFRSRANLGATDFSVQMRALYYVGLPPLDDALPDANLEGWSAETGLTWTWNKFPLAVNLGYRLERFKVFNREMETSAMYVGTGLLLGRRPRPAAATPATPAPAPTTPPATQGNAQGRP